MAKRSPTDAESSKVRGVIIFMASDVRRLGTCSVRRHYCGIPSRGQTMSEGGQKFCTDVTQPVMERVYNECMKVAILLFCKSVLEIPRHCNLLFVFC